MGPTAPPSHNFSPTKDPRQANREDLTEQLIGFVHDQLEHETIFGLGTNGNTEYEITDLISESFG